MLGWSYKAITYHLSPTWIDAPVIADTFILNIGDLLMRWTNDRLVSMHDYRVKRFAAGVGDNKPFTASKRTA